MRRGSDAFEGSPSFVLPAFRLVLNDAIAIAGGLAELVEIGDGDIAAGVGDHAGFLQNAGSNADTGATCAQHLSEKFLGERHVFVADAVVAHQQPAGQAFFDTVQAVAGGQLRRLEGEQKREAFKFQF